MNMCWDVIVFIVDDIHLWVYCQQHVRSIQYVAAIQRSVPQIPDRYRVSVFIPGHRHNSSSLEITSYLVR